MIDDCLLSIEGQKMAVASSDYADMTPQDVFTALYKVMTIKTPELKFIKTWSRFMVRESVAWALGERGAKPAHFRYYERR